MMRTNLKDLRQSVFGPPKVESGTSLDPHLMTPNDIIWYDKSESYQSSYLTFSRNISIQGESVVKGLPLELESTRVTPTISMVRFVLYCSQFSRSFDQHYLELRIRSV